MVDCDLLIMAEFFGVAVALLGLGYLVLIGLIVALGGLGFEFVIFLWVVLI